MTRGKTHKHTNAKRNTKNEPSVVPSHCTESPVSCLCFGSCHWFGRHHRFSSVLCLVKMDFESMRNTTTLYKVQKPHMFGALPIRAHCCLLACSIGTVGAPLLVQASAGLAKVQGEEKGEGGLVCWHQTSRSQCPFGVVINHIRENKTRTQA